MRARRISNKNALSFGKSRQFSSSESPPPATQERGEGKGEGIVLKGSKQIARRLCVRRALAIVKAAPLSFSLPAQSRGESVHNPFRGIRNAEAAFTSVNSLKYPRNESLCDAGASAG